jgi:hypothetical protein
MLPGATYHTTRAVTVNAPPEAVWPWIVQMGQGRGGLYSYEFLENLVGCDLHNADRIHPEWQDLQAGDYVRFIPEGYMGMAEIPRWTVREIRPNQALVLEPWGTYALQPQGQNATRLIIRSHAPDALSSVEPFNFIMGRRTLLGIQERVEGHTVPAWQDALEVVLWALAFVVSLVAGLMVLFRKTWVRPLATLAASIAVLLFAVFWRPDLWIVVALDAGLISMLLWAFDAPMPWEATTRPQVTQPKPASDLRGAGQH